MLRRFGIALSRGATMLELAAATLVRPAAAAWRRAPSWMRLAAGAGSVAVLLTGTFAAGMTVNEVRFFERGAAHVERNWQQLERAMGLIEESDALPVDVREIATFMHGLVEQTIGLGDFGGQGGSIVEYGDGLIFVESREHLGYVSFDGAVWRLDQKAPMRFDAFLAWLEREQQGVDTYFFRTLDSLIIRDESGDRLLVSYQRFADDDCIQVVVSSIGLGMADDKPVLGEAGWKDVFVSKSCVPLPPEVSRFEGLEAGGRMALLEPGKLLLTVGYFGLDGVHMGSAVSLDPSSDLGKIIEIDLATGASRMFSMGHRNPQGLLIDSQGRIWETEHGPRGGDEINIILEGRSYGWPETTYGLDYEGIWPKNSVQGRHRLDYELPKFFFAPSVGISNVVEITGEEFPLWTGDLLIGSLDGASLFRVRLEGETVLSVEEIPIGERIRDIAVLRHGRIAVLTDTSKLKVYQRLDDADRPYKPLPASFTGYAALAAARAADPNGGHDLTISDRGERLFRRYCSSCHAVDGSPAPGPDLRGVQGRRVASVPGYAYSPALKGAGGRWDYWGLHGYLSDPQEAVPGTAMQPSGLHPYDVHAVVSYLGTL